MAQHTLTDRFVKTAGDGFHGDGGNLYFQVRGGSRLWVFRYRDGDKKKKLSLGSYPEVPLAEARDKAAAQRKVLVGGVVKPQEYRKAEQLKAAVAAAKTVTFDAARDLYFDSKVTPNKKTGKVAWGAKHAGSWKARLETYASPVFGTYSVSEINETLVQKALDPVKSMSETMHRLQEGIAKVLSFAIARKYRVGPNPAAWADNLEHAGFEPRDPERHHESLPYAKLPAFMAELRRRDGDAPLALMFTILTGVRASEAVEADWCEIDLEAKLWTIPAKRMKMEREHKVPLSAAAVRILRTMRPKPSGPVFPGRDGGSMTTAAMLVLVKRMRPELTVHGFRSTLRIYAEENGHDSRVSEMALAHVVGSKVEQAYLRGAEMFAKRRELMNAWAGYATGIAVARSDAA